MKLEVGQRVARVLDVYGRNVEILRVVLAENVTLHRIGTKLLDENGDIVDGALGKTFGFAIVEDLLPVVERNSSDLAVGVAADALIPRGSIAADAAIIKLAEAAGLLAVEDFQQRGVHAVGGRRGTGEPAAVVLLERGLRFGGLLVVRKRTLDDVAVFVMGGDADHIRTAAVAGEPDNAAAAVCAFHGKTSFCFVKIKMGLVEKRGPKTLLVTCCKIPAVPERYYGFLPSP